MELWIVVAEKALTFSCTGQLVLQDVNGVDVAEFLKDLPNIVFCEIARNLACEHGH